MNILSDGGEKAQKTENKKSLASASGSSSSQKQETDARANAQECLGDGLVLAFVNCLGMFMNVYECLGMIRNVLGHVNL